MENAHTITQLVHLGFSEKEALLYLALIENGRLSVTALANKSGIPRTSCYHLLDQLTQKKLVYVTGKEPVLEYVAEHPRQLQLYMQRQSEEAREKSTYAQGISEQLSALYKQDTRPQVKFYEGRVGLQKIYEDTLQADKKGIYAFANVDDVHATLPHYFPTYYKRRAAKNIPIRAIFPDSTEARKLTKHDKEEKRTSILVDAEKYGFSPEINIYNETIMIASWREKLGITIESPEIADALKKIYELAWIGAQSLKK